jgi:hypothetical protein
MSRTDDIINVRECCALMREKILDEIGTALKGRGVGARSS